MTLYSSALVMKLFNNSKSYFKRNGKAPKASLLLNALLRIHPLTFITEALCLLATVGVPSVVSATLP